MNAKNRMNATRAARLMMSHLSFKTEINTDEGQGVVERFSFEASITLPCILAFAAPFSVLVSVLSVVMTVPPLLPLWLCSVVRMPGTLTSASLYLFDART